MIKVNDLLQKLRLLFPPLFSCIIGKANAVSPLLKLPTVRLRVTSRAT